MTPDLTVEVLGSGVSDGVVQLMGVLLGSALTLASTFGLERHKDRRDAKRLSIAIAAEVGASLRMVELRGYVPDLRMALDAAASGNPVHIQATLGDDYLPVCRAASSSIGALPGPIPALLAELMTLVRSLKIDFDELADSESPASQGDAAVKAKLYGEMLEILERAVVVGGELVADVERRYKTHSTRS